MMSGLFTDKAIKVRKLAEQEAVRRHHEYIGTEHLLLGLVKGELNVAMAVLENLEVNYLQFSQAIDEIVQPSPDDASRRRSNLPLTPRAKKAIEGALDEARDFGHKFAGPEHLLLGLLREDGSVAAEVLKKQGLKLESVRAEVLKILGDPERPDKED